MDDAPTTINVVGNPFCAELDHKGRAHGRLVMESHVAQDKMPPRFIGARLYSKTLRAADKKRQIESLEDHVMVYDPAPQVVPLTPYYIRALQDHGHHGAPIFCADLESHKAVFGTEAGFRHPLARIAQLADERKTIPVLLGAPVVEGAFAPDHKADDVAAHFHKIVDEHAKADEAAWRARNDEATKKITEAAAAKAKLKADADAATKAAAQASTPQATSAGKVA